MYEDLYDSKDGFRCVVLFHEHQEENYAVVLLSSQIY